MYVVYTCIAILTGVTMGYLVVFCLQRKVTPTSVIFAPNGQLFAVMATDGKVVP